jgi:hypothetical protein
VPNDPLGKRIQLGIAAVAVVAASLVGFAVFGGTSAPAPVIYPGPNDVSYYATHPPPPHSCYPPSCIVHYGNPTPTTVPSRSQS